MRVFGSAKEANEFVKTTPIAGPSFELAIADGFTFAGRVVEVPGRPLVGRDHGA